MRGMRGSAATLAAWAAVLLGVCTLQGCSSGDPGSSEVPATSDETTEATTTTTTTTVPETRSCHLDNSCACDIIMCDGKERSARRIARRRRRGEDHYKATAGAGKGSLSSGPLC